MSDPGPEEPEHLTMYEMEADSEPVWDDRALVALNSEDSEEFTDELMILKDEEANERHDEFLARRIMAMEAAGVPGEAIVDFLVDDLARGETW